MGSDKLLKLRLSSMSFCLLYRQEKHTNLIYHAEVSFAWNSLQLLAGTCQLSQMSKRHPLSGKRLQKRSTLCRIHVTRNLERWLSLQNPLQYNILSCRHVSSFCWWPPLWWQSSETPLFKLSNNCNLSCAPLISDCSWCSSAISRAISAARIPNIKQTRNKPVNCTETQRMLEKYLILLLAQARESEDQF